MSARARTHANAYAPVSLFGGGLPVIPVPITSINRLPAYRILYAFVRDTIFITCGLCMKVGFSPELAWQGRRPRLDDQHSSRLDLEVCGTIHS